MRNLKVKLPCLFLVVLLALSLTSCYSSGGEKADYPRHLYENSAEVQKKIPKEVIMPSLSKTEFKGWDSKFYTVNLIGKVTTGYSIEVESIKENEKVFSTAEMRGIKTSIKGTPPEGFSDKSYTAIVKETPIKIGERDCKYAAFTDKLTTDEDLPEQKETSSAVSVPTDNLNIKYFYIYTEDDDIRYSITFKDFSVGTINEDICDACLKNSKGFFENIKKP